MIIWSIQKLIIMGWLKKLFGTKKEETNQKIEVGNGIFVDEQGNISGELEISASLNDKETSQRISINTSVEKLDKWLREQHVKQEEAERNKDNPDSCEREPNQDEVKIPIDKVSEYQSALPYKHPLGEMMFEAKLNTIETGYNNIIVLREDFLTIERYYNAQQRTYTLLGNANVYEKNGDTDLAIEAYQEVISIGYSGAGYAINKPYDRLMILYRKKKEVDNEINIIRQTIVALSAQNKISADRSIKEHPEKENEILTALPLCTRVMGDNGFYIYIPYDVPKYQVRLEKLLLKKK